MEGGGTKTALSYVKKKEGGEGLKGKMSKLIHRRPIKIRGAGAACHGGKKRRKQTDKGKVPANLFE